MFSCDGEVIADGTGIIGIDGDDGDNGNSDGVVTDGALLPVANGSDDSDDEESEASPGPERRPTRLRSRLCWPRARASSKPWGRDLGAINLEEIADEKHQCGRIWHSMNRFAFTRGIARDAQARGRGTDYKID